MHLIEQTMAKQLEWCGKAPLYRLDPLKTAIAPRDDHPTCGTGAAMIGCPGCARLRRLTPGRQ